MAADHRQAVFARIREALKVPAPHRHTGHIGEHPIVPDDTSHTADDYRAWLPVVGATPADQLELFTAHCAALKTELHRCASLEEAAIHFAAMSVENGWKKVAAHRHPLVTPVIEKTGLPLLLTDDGYVIAEMEQCPVAVSGCDALVAQTGSILVSSGSAGGRALSVLPPHHVVVARESQLVPDLAAALGLASARYAAKWPSFLSFITGPSRTGDIERILVLGAHGPKRLSVFLVP